MGKKTREPSPSGSSSSSASSDAGVPIPNKEESKKRKRPSVVAEEIEVDLNAPEPLSKAAARKAKKAKTKAPPAVDENGDPVASTDTPATTTTPSGNQKRSEYGVWIGNLPFVADKLMVRLFFTRTAGIPDLEITRMHMPTPTQPPIPGRPKPLNKGFAYVDFATADNLEKALAVSETLMSGRKVLIKDAKSYAGRPEKATATSDALAGNAPAATIITEDGKKEVVSKNGMPPSKRVFVGNLGFDVTRDELETHFSQAGDIEDVFMATFEDTGKCKGFAWVRFADLETAEAAVRGFFFKAEDASDDEGETEPKADKDSDDSDDDDDDDGTEEKEPKRAKEAKKAAKQKKRKWFINRLNGRTLRCEFAEDAQTRYKKRYGKQAPSTGAGGGFRASRDDQQEGGAPITEVNDRQDRGGEQKRRQRGGDKDQRQDDRRRKFDARKIAPGAALANAPRASGAIVEGKGKKMTFEE